MSNGKEFDKYKELFGDDVPGECQACGAPLSLERVNLEDYQGGKLFMMEKVPAFVCEGCGEIWVPEPVMLEFERMIEIVKQRKAAKGTKKKNPVSKGKSKKRGGKKK